jgi:hypothetical protein
VLDAATARLKLHSYATALYLADGTPVLGTADIVPKADLVAASKPRRFLPPKDDTAGGWKGSDRSPTSRTCRSPREGQQSPGLALQLWSPGRTGGPSPRRTGRTGRRSPGRGGGHPTASAEYVAAAFALIDKNGNGWLSRAEVIKALRTEPSVRALLGLGETVRQEDGSRGKFEAGLTIGLVPTFLWTGQSGARDRFFL